MDLSSNNNEITVWQHHIKCICYRIFEKNLYCDYILVFHCISGSMDYWKLFRTHKYLKHKTLLNKSITIYFGVTVYSLQTQNISFSFEGYSCKSILLVQFITISVRWRSCSNWPTQCSMPRRGKNKHFQDITGHCILPSCPLIRIYWRQLTNTDENIFRKAQTFSI